jgi:rfaE bifunctional protein nucleotidyltransferase chain/domain/rfaE bifunctional protein kinase chain/domain
MVRLLVIGDVFLDVDVDGTSDRVCPDAPALVVEEQQVRERLGGAGLAAHVATTVPGVEHVTLVCGLGVDPAARRVLALASAAGLDVVAAPTVGSTVEKIRVCVDGRPVVRVDRGSGADASPTLEWGDALVEALDRADAVLVADYGRGVAGHAAVRDALTDFVDSGRPVVWDPHPRGGAPLAGVAVVTPSEREAASMAARGDGGSAGRWTSAAGDAATLLARWSAKSVVVTCGSAGAMLVRTGAAPMVVPVDDPASGADACGAGDAFAAACAVHLASGCVTSEAVERAVAGASAFVRSGGAGRLSRRGGEVSIGGGPVAPSPDRRTIVAAGGCFDVLHAGHVQLLQQARRLGDRLVVLLNSDDSVRRLKGPGRPVHREADRADMLRALACVDEVLVFDDETPVEVLRELRPDVFVKGGDYAVLDVERSVLEEWGGSVVVLPYVAGRSTTAILSHSA